MQFLGDTLYLPHNLDFRGRAYPIPPHLNHLGDDLSRGLLKFAEKKPLGERGLRWLKIHLANLYGFDKANFDERVAFVEDHLELIYDSATKPLDVRFYLHFSSIASNSFLGQTLVAYCRRPMAMSSDMYGTPLGPRIPESPRIHVLPSRSSGRDM